MDPGVLKHLSWRDPLHRVLIEVCDGEATGGATCRWVKYGRSDPTERRRGSTEQVPPAEVRLRGGFGLWRGRCEGRWCAGVVDAYSAGEDNTEEAGRDSDPAQPVKMQEVTVGLFDDDPSADGGADPGD